MRPPLSHSHSRRRNRCCNCSCFHRFPSSGASHRTFRPRREGTAPKPVVPVRVREPKERHSGFFYKENFWNLDADERRGKMIRVNHDAGLKAEWNDIMMALAAPREVPLTLSESQKAKLFTSPSILPHDEAFATGKPQTVDEIQKTFAPTMGNANPDSGISVDLDRRGRLPDTPTKELTPSR